MTTGLRYARFVGLAGLSAALLAGVGYLPTRRLGGDAALLAMLAGIAISLAGASLAAWPLVAIRRIEPMARLQAAMLAMAVRLLAVIALGAAAALSGAVARAPLLFWMAASYVALLPLEVKLALDGTQDRAGREQA